MKELQLKYGCNPNQKPSRIFMEMVPIFRSPFSTDVLATLIFLMHSMAGSWSVN